MCLHTDGFEQNKQDSSTCTATCLYTFKLLSIRYQFLHKLTISNFHSPSLISLMVSVDVKHHVYLLTAHAYQLRKYISNYL